MKSVYNATEVAEKLGVSEHTIWRHIKEGKLPASKPGKSFVITRSDLIEYLGSEDRVDEIFGKNGKS